MPFTDAQQLESAQEQSPVLEVQQPVVVSKPSKKKSIFKSKKLLLITASIFTAIGVTIGLIVPALIPKKTVPPPEVPVTITMWGESLDEEELQPLIKAFEEQNPLIKVQYEKPITTDYKDVLKTRLSLRNVSQLPDIVEVNESWEDEFRYYLNPLVDSDLFKRYEALSLNNNNIGNQIYGIPFKFDSLMLAYNKKHLEEIGTNEAELNKLSWSSLIEKAKALSKSRVVINKYNTDIITTRAGIGIGSPDTTSNAAEILQLLLIQEDSPIYSPKTNSFALDQSFDKVFQFYSNFTLERAWAENIGKDMDAFINGNLSMVIARTADIDYINANKPAGFDFGTALPGKFGAVRNISLSTSLVLPKDKPNIEQSKKFIKFITDPANSIKLFQPAKNKSFIPAQRDALTKIPQESPFSTFADINPSAEKFVSPNYEVTTQVLEDFLRTTFSQNITKGNESQVKKFTFDSQTLEKNLNTAFAPPPTATPAE